MTIVKIACAGPVVNRHDESSQMILFVNDAKPQAAKYVLSEMLAFRWPATRLRVPGPRRIQIRPSTMSIRREMRRVIPSTMWRSGFKFERMFSHWGANVIGSRIPDKSIKGSAIMFRIGA